MKKFNLLLVGVLISSLTFAFGRDESPSGTGMAVVKKSATSYKLIYKSELASDVRVKIFNERNILVYSEIIKNSNGFSRPYNFERLGEGEYTIKVDNGSGWLTGTVLYQDGEVEMLAHLTKLEDGKFLVTVPGKGKDQLTVRVLNEQGEVIKRYENKVEGDFAQVYDVSKVTGPVSFEISNQRCVTTTLKK